MGAKVLTADVSSVFLPEQGDLRRLLRAQNRKRPQKFIDEFEDRALVYDCFWHQDGQRVLLVCPPPLSLKSDWLKATFICSSGKQILSPKFYIQRSSMIIELANIPQDTNQLELTFAEMEFILPIRPNLSEEFSERRILFSMNKNNDLAWIKEWAAFHQSIHKADAIVLFDNGSTTYGVRDIEQTLLDVPGLKKILIMSLPYRFGAKDPKVFMHPYWAHFLQNASFSLMLRRIAGQGFGMLNMDIDELVAPVPDGDIFQLTRESTSGFHVLNGRWVENILSEHHDTQQQVHRDFHHVLRDFRSGLNAKKWALDPDRKWLEDLNLQPSWHKIKHMPKHLVSVSANSNYWHFKGINTNWKKRQSMPQKPSIFCRIDHELIHSFNKYTSDNSRLKESI